jgi:crotonobetainyl-CoA:carnitine CoA-transferase CaiB-like acyl-CoA transferase
VIGEDSFLAMNDEIDTWARRDEIFAKTRDKLKTKTSAEWLELLRAADIWCGPVYGYADLVDDEQIKHNGTFVEYEHPTEGKVKTPGFPIRFSKTPSTVDRGAPVTGQDTRDVLAEAGYAAYKIEALEKSGAIVSGNI